MIHAYSIEIVPVDYEIMDRIKEASVDLNSFSVIKYDAKESTLICY